MDQIELKDYSIELSDTARPIRQNLLQDETIKPNRRANVPKKRIFNQQEFWVSPMADPLSYLPNDRYRNNSDYSAVEMVKHTCGECAICLSHLFACCCCTCYMYQLETSKVGLVEKFGRFSRLLTPGFNFINPCSQEVREIDIKLNVVNAGVTDAITKDNVQIKVFSAVGYRIINPVLAYYRIGQNLQRGIKELVTSTFRNTIGVHNLQKVLTDRIEIIRQVKEQVMKNMPVGISIDNIFLQDIKIPGNIERDLSSVAKERRLAEAMIIDNQADVKSAALMKETAELLDTKAAMQIRYLQMVQSIGQRGVTLLMEIGVNKKGYQEIKPN